MDKKILVISQPRYLPSLNYIHRMILADEFVYLDNVQYTARDWENRNRIKTPQGETWLSVPIEKGKRERQIKDTYISKSDDKWASKHLRTLEMNYKKSPFFQEIYPFLQEIYSTQWDRLMDLNIGFVNFVVEYLNIECKFSLASECHPTGTGQDLLIDICKRKNASGYLSGPLGDNYIDKDVWEKNKLELIFHQYNFPNYKQQFGEFIPWLSVVDLLMNCGKESREIISREQQVL